MTLRRSLGSILVLLSVGLSPAISAPSTTETSDREGSTVSGQQQQQQHPLVRTDEVVQVAVADDIEFDETDYSFAHPIFQRGLNLGSYIQKHVLESPKSIDTMRHQLDIGSVVVIPNAFDIDFAEAAHKELMNANYSLYRNSFDDGFSYNHHNIYSKGQYSAFLNQTQRIFTSRETKDFMSEFTSVDCSGMTNAAPSYYAPGDYSNPHSDHESQRTLSFVWHLTKNDWKPEWGGALYWCKGHPDHSYLHASFNTLIIFKPTTQSQHFVTRVSHNVTTSTTTTTTTTTTTGNNAKKRLAYNGWYHATWFPQEISDLDPWLTQATTTTTTTGGDGTAVGADMTALQYDQISNFVHDNQFENDEQRSFVRNAYKSLYRQRYPPARTYVEIDAKLL